MIIGLFASHCRHWLYEELEAVRQKRQPFKIINIALQLKDNRTPQLREKLTTK
jgi:hypothetical protein